MLYSLDQTEETVALPEEITHLMGVKEDVSETDRILIGGLLGDAQVEMLVDEDLFYNQERILETWFGPSGLPIKGDLERYVDRGETSIVVTQEIREIHTPEEAMSVFETSALKLGSELASQLNKIKDESRRRTLINNDIVLRHILVAEICDRLANSGCETNEIQNLAENLMARTAALDWMDNDILIGLSKDVGARISYSKKNSALLKALTEQIVYGTPPDLLFREILKLTPETNLHQGALAKLEAGARAEAGFVEMVENCQQLKLIESSEGSDALEATDYLVEDVEGNIFRVNVKSSEYNTTIGCQGYRGKRRPVEYFRDGQEAPTLDVELIPYNLRLKASQGDRCLVVYLKPGDDLENEETLAIMRNTMHRMLERSA